LDEDAWEEVDSNVGCRCKSFEKRSVNAFCKKKKDFSSSAGNHNFSKIIFDYKYAAFGFMNLCQK
jgi:hypothetical protein